MRTTMMMIPATIILLALIEGLSSSPAAANLPVHAELEAQFDEVLVEVVEDGRVDYAALKRNPEPLDRWLRRIELVSWIEVRKWLRPYQIAFYINAYNGHVLRLVRDHYPIQGQDGSFPANSIQQIPNVWNLPLRVAQEDLSLDEIEKGILLTRFKDHRVHFALVCASTGCPKLMNVAYHGSRLGDQLNLAAQMFIRSPIGSRLDQKQRVLWLSPLFDWYRTDFNRLAGVAPILKENFHDLAGSVAFVASHRTLEESRFIRHGDFRVEFFDYDWALNERIGPKGD